MNGVSRIKPETLMLWGASCCKAWFDGSDLLILGRFAQREKKVCMVAAAAVTATAAPRLCPHRTNLVSCS